MVFFALTGVVMIFVAPIMVVLVGLDAMVLMLRPAGATPLLDDWMAMREVYLLIWKQKIIAAFRPSLPPVPKPEPVPGLHRTGGGPVRVKVVVTGTNTPPTVSPPEAAA